MARSSNGTLLKLKALWWKHHPGAKRDQRLGTAPRLVNGALRRSSTKTGRFRSRKDAQGRTLPKSPKTMKIIDLRRLIASYFSAIHRRVG
ncbi:MAG: hypothetical protein AB4426_23480 [Xenococcaceae cyanobacterium]